MPTAELTAARLRRPGPGAAHILLVAGRAWLAEGRSSDEQRLPVRLLDRLWLTTRRGIELDVVCGVDRVLRMLESFAGSWNLARYDAVVLLPDPGGRPMSARTQRVIDRVAAVTHVLGVSDSVLRPGVPTDAGGAVGWDEIRVDPGPDDHPATAAVHAVEGALAAVLRTGAADRVAEVPRPTALVEHLQRIAMLASTTFSVGSSAIAVLAAEGTRTLAAVGSALAGPNWVRTAAVEPQLVLDAWRDSRFRQRATAADGVRFFAAYPLQRADGTSIGALSVFDPEPRSEDEFDCDVLRDLAVLASAEIQYAGARA